MAYTRTVEKEEVNIVYTGTGWSGLGDETLPATLPESGAGSNDVVITLEEE